MKILVVGAGSMGGYFGGQLAAAGRDVTFLVRAARAAQLERDGMSIASKYGNFTFAPKLISAEALKTPYDLILLAVKAYSLQAAMTDFAGAVGPETMILPLLNGMLHLDTLAKRFGEGVVLGGTAYISTDLDAQGRILHLDSLRDLYYGERGGAITPRMQELQGVLSVDGFAEKLSAEIVAVMWRKWSMLTSLASITCMMRGSIGHVAATPQGLKTAHAIVDECAAVAEAEGYPIPAEYLEQTHARMTKAGSDLTASMYRDLQRGAPVEVDEVVGDMLRRADAHGIDAPLVRAAFVHLSVYQNSRAK